MDIHKIKLVIYIYYRFSKREIVLWLVSEAYYLKTNSFNNLSFTPLALFCFVRSLAAILDLSVAANCRAVGGAPRQVTVMRWNPNFQELCDVKVILLYNKTETVKWDVRNNHINLTSFKLTQSWLRRLEMHAFHRDCWTLFFFVVPFWFLSSMVY